MGTSAIVSKSEITACGWLGQADILVAAAPLDGVEAFCDPLPFLCCYAGCVDLLISWPFNMPGRTGPIRERQWKHLPLPREDMAWVQSSVF